MGKGINQIGNDVLGFVKKASSDIADATTQIGNSVVSEVVNTANTVGSTVSKSVNKAGNIAVSGVVNAVNNIGTGITGVANKVGEKTVKTLDLNGDGKIDEQDVLVVLNAIYDNTINGIPKVSKSIEEFSEDYLKRYSDAKIAAKKMIDNAIVKCTTSGFLTGFGGLIVLPVTLPANLTSVIYVQMRMIASVAYMAGLDVKSDVTQTLIYACLAGVSIAEIVKKAGIQVGQKFTNAMVKKIPGTVLTKINQKVGFRLLTKFGEKGVVNIGKMIPVVGAVISGGFDLTETRIIANRAYKEFFEGDFILKEEMTFEENSPNPDTESEL